MSNSKPRILYISSADPLKGPGAIGMSHYLEFRDAGYHIDMLTLYPVYGYPEILYVNRSPLWDKINNKLSRLLGTALPRSSYQFFYKKETQPPVAVKKVLRAIKKDYDLLIVYFWQGLLSFQTVDAIYEKTGHPVVFFFSPDYSHMAGGCHFPCDCERYQIGCGCCPAFHSNNENDFTHQNVLFRKKVYDKIKPIVFGNTYMNLFYEKSYLLKDQITIKSRPRINTLKFHPIDKLYLRKKYDISDNITFIISFGSQSLTNKKKGFSYLIEALNIFAKGLPEIMKKEILLLIAGDNYDKIKSHLPFSSKGLGFLPVNDLCEFYSLADIFVCPSINDAGPSMVGQSISCGTPVVGFEMGALLDWVKDRDTGYCAILRDSNDLAKGISKFYKMSHEQRQDYFVKCRDFALECSNVKRFDRLMNLYKKYSSEK